MLNVASASIAASAPETSFVLPIPRDTEAIGILLKVQTALNRFAGGPTVGDRDERLLIRRALRFIPLAIAGDRATAMFCALDGATTQPSPELLDAWEAAKKREDVTQTKARRAAHAVLELRASSLAGLLAKAAVRVWADQTVIHVSAGDENTTDVASEAAIIRDLIALAAPLAAPDFAPAAECSRLEKAAA